MCLISELKLKLMQKRLVPKQLDLFQNQPKMVCIQDLSFLSAQDGLSSLEMAHTGGTPSSQGSTERSVGPVWHHLL